MGHSGSIRLAAATLLCGVIASPGSIARAQYSPNCERNGKRAYCAITPKDGPGRATETLTAITFADHMVYEVVRNEVSCKDSSGNIRTCNARILSPGGQGKWIPAFYRGTYYEGGYKHEYVGKGIHITYFFLD